MQNTERRNIDEYLSHFWTPDEPKFLDYSWTFDQSKRAMVPASLMYESACSGFAELPRTTRIRFQNQTARYITSVVLQLEKTALAAYRELARLGVDVDFEIREETRHIAAFSKFLQLRWDGQHSLDHLSTTLRTVQGACSTLDDYEALLDVIETLNLGFFTTLHAHGQDPLLVRVCSFTIADEYVHRGQPRQQTYSARIQETIVQPLIEAFSAALSPSGVAGTYSSLTPVLDFGGIDEDDSLARQVVGQFIRARGWNFPGNDKCEQDYRQLASRIAGSARRFLEGFAETDVPQPDEHLALDWMLAGLRGTPYWETDGSGV